MREVEIPGGKAFFREPGKDPMPGRAVKLIKAAAMSAGTQLSEYPEIFEAVDDESDEERNRRISPRLSSLRLSVEQAMAIDTLREATVVGTLASWTLDRPLPTFESIGDLDDDLYQALLSAVGGVSSAELEESFAETPLPRDLATRGVSEDDRPTSDSGSSNEQSRVDPNTLPTTTSSPATSASDGDDSSREQ